MGSNIFVIYGNEAFTMTEELLAQREWFKGLSPNANIVLKPNLVVSKPSSSGATTEPKIIEAIVAHLRKRGFTNLSIIESAWLGDDTKSAFRVCGYEEISRKHDVPIFDLKDDTTDARDGLSICRKALSADLIINVPVLKAHCQTRLTCALKNMKGVIPDCEKRRYHQLGIHKPVAQLNSLLPPQLVIVDGICGDLTFEEGGTPVEMNRMFIGTDPVLVDSYAATLLGYESSRVAYIALARELGVGSDDLGTLNLTELNSPGTREFLDDRAQENRQQMSSLTRNVDARDACSSCFGSLVHALQRLSERGLLPFEKSIAIGQAFRKLETDENTIGIGSCTSCCRTHLSGCPPKADDIIRFLCQYGKD